MTPKCALSVACGARKAGVSQPGRHPCRGVSVWVRLEWSGVCASTGWLEVGIPSRGGGGSARGRGVVGWKWRSGGVCVASMRGVCANLHISQPARACSSVDLGTWVQRIQRAMHIMGIKGWCAEVEFTLRSTTIPKGWASFECGAQEGYPRSILLVARLSLHITCSDGRYSSTNPAPDSVRVRQFTTACTTCSSFRMLRSTSGATEQVVPTESTAACHLPYGCSQRDRRPQSSP
jgi:hypothetical protein